MRNLPNGRPPDCQRSTVDNSGLEQFFQGAGAVDRQPERGQPPDPERKIPQGRPNGRPPLLLTVDRSKPRKVLGQPSVNGQPLLMERSTARLETVDRWSQPVDRCGCRKLLKVVQREFSEA